MKSLSYSTCTSVSLSAIRVGSIRVDSSDIANGTEKNTVNVDIFACIHFCENMYIISMSTFIVLQVVFGGFLVSFFQAY